jgi:CelD/BcsL family acetyltransferase involved in cellulose biosynthesis
MQIVVLRISGRPVAFDHTFTLGQTLFLHRLGFDPAYARYSPGLVTTLETLRHASTEGVTRVEFLGGGERYKIELADRHEPLYQAIGFVRNPLGSLAARQRLALIKLRKALKRNERIQRIYLNGFNALRRSKKRDSATP